MISTTILEEGAVVFALDDDTGIDVEEQPVGSVLL
jgi:hypothetical protein